MPGYTTKGVPYILGADSASTIDDTSLLLANFIEAYMPFRVAAGSGTVTLTSASNGTTAITFPTSRFTIAPLVFCTLQNTNGPTVTARASSITTSGFTLYVSTGNNGTTSATITAAWWAVQMTTTTAAG
jgi:hypothetical protein